MAGGLQRFERDPIRPNAARGTRLEILTAAGLFFPNARKSEHPPNANSQDVLPATEGTSFALRMVRTEGAAMSLVRLLGFRTLNCGCVIGRYRELATSREVSYVEEKGGTCDAHSHRRNHTIHEPASAVPSLVTRAS